MSTGLGFITEDDFYEHVEATIKKYGEKLESFDLERFNKNTLDPVKLLFDKIIYGVDWKQIVDNEIFRQRDKAANNDIGYFHQCIFKYFPKCNVPDNGKEGGWDVIYRNDEGITLPDGDVVRTVYVEMKNKHNTMNSASSAKTYIKMQNQLLKDDDCACFLVEVIAKRSQNIKWETTVDGNKVSHKRIRRVSIDKFYEIATGEHDSFYKMCMKLPEVIEKVLSESDVIKKPKDTVMDDLENVAKYIPEADNETSFLLSVFMLGFSSYNGFGKVWDIDIAENDSVKERMYNYLKKSDQAKKKK